MVNTALIAYLVFVALLFGSFINMAADRLPRGESIVRPRSHCRACGRVLNAADLLPVLGYVVRRGRCATCSTAISVSSPVIEAVCGAGMLASLLWLGLWPGVLVGFSVVAALGSAVTMFALRRENAALPSQ